MYDFPRADTSSVGIEPFQTPFRGFSPYNLAENMVKAVGVTPDYNVTAVSLFDSLNDGCFHSLVLSAGIDGSRLADMVKQHRLPNLERTPF